MLQEAFEQLREGQFESALEAFNACLALSPVEPEAYRGRGLAHFQLKQWSPAAMDFRKAGELNPDEPGNAIGLGMSLAMQSEVYPALDVLEDLVARRPDYVPGLIQLGLLYFKLCLIAKGREHLEKALASRPGLAERRLIEETLKDEKKLDQKRYYRPDFEALRKVRRAAS